jgi:hypothetical protein
MKPHEKKKQVQNKSEKEWKNKGDKKTKSKKENSPPFRVNFPFFILFATQPTMQPK